MNSPDDSKYDEEDFSDYASSLATALKNFWLRMINEALEDGGQVRLGREFLPDGYDVQLWSKTIGDYEKVQDKCPEILGAFVQKLLEGLDEVDLSHGKRLKRDGNGFIVDCI